MCNKAHSAAINRILDRYGGASGKDQGVDIAAAGMWIEVETTATLLAGLARLSKLTGTRYLAVTNQEGLSEALLLARGTGIGVMDSRGNIVQSADGDGEVPNGERQPG